MNPGMLSSSVEIRSKSELTNILQAAFLYKVLCLQYGLVFFWQKEIGSKAAHKVLVN